MHDSAGEPPRIRRCGWHHRKARYTGHASNIAQLSWGIRLFFCNEQEPQEDEGWLMSHCGQRGFNEGIFFDPTPEVTIIRTAPPPSQDGAHGNGWFMACTTWQTRTTLAMSVL